MSPLLNDYYNDLTPDELNFFNDWRSERIEDHGGLFHCLRVEDYGHTNFHDYNSDMEDCSVFTFEVNVEA